MDVINVIGLGLVLVLGIGAVVLSAVRLFR